LVGEPYYQDFPDPFTFYVSQARIPNRFYLLAVYPDLTAGAELLKNIIAKFQPAQSRDNICTAPLLPSNTNFSQSLIPTTPLLIPNGCGQKNLYVFGGWYYFTVTTSGTYRFQVCPSGFSTNFFLFHGDPSCPSLTDIGNTSCSKNITGNSCKQITYVVLPDQLPLRVNALITLPWSTTAKNFNNYWDLTPAALNMDLCRAIELVPGISYSADLNGTVSKTFKSCQSGTLNNVGYGVWYYFDAVIPGFYKIKICGLPRLASQSILKQDRKISVQIFMEQGT